MGSRKQRPGHLERMQDEGRAVGLAALAAVPLGGGLERRTREGQVVDEARNRMAALLAGCRNLRCAPARRTPQRGEPCLSVMPSSTLATRSQASTDSSSVSKMSFQRITTIGSIPWANNCATAVRTS